MTQLVGCSAGFVHGEHDNGHASILPSWCAAQTCQRQTRRVLHPGTPTLQEVQG